MEVKAYAVKEQGAALEPMTIERRAPGSEDVLVELQYCGSFHGSVQDRLAPLGYRIRLADFLPGACSLRLPLYSYARGAEAPSNSKA